MPKEPKLADVLKTKVKTPIQLKQPQIKPIYANKHLVDEAKPEEKKELKLREGTEIIENVYNYKPITTDNIVQLLDNLEETTINDINTYQVQTIDDNIIRLLGIQ